MGVFSFIKYFLKFLIFENKSFNKKNFKYKKKLKILSKITIKCILTTYLIIFFEKHFSLKKMFLKNKKMFYKI